MPRGQLVRLRNRNANGDPAPDDQGSCTAPRERAHPLSGRRVVQFNDTRAVTETLHLKGRLEHPR
jgi:hypothetical protein